MYFAPALLVGAITGASTAAVRDTRATPESKTDSSKRVHPVISAPQRCVECHQHDASLNHPVDVAPSMAVPAGLPLERGRMSCSTCHEDPTLGIGGAASLRGSMSGAAFCGQCHEGNRDLEKRTHTSGSRAHLRTDRRWETRSARQGKDMLDAESRSCMSCHDGGVAFDAGQHAPIMDMGRNEDRRGEHPIGVAYDRPERDAEIRLNPTMRLDSRIRLFDGALGCGSCHSVYSKSKKLLVMSNDHSRLCLSCHVE